MAPKKVAKRPAAKAYKLPDKIAQGQILVDVTRKQWRLGKSVGQGGFGEIYLASDIIDKPVGDHANFVIKVEPHSNGPLFTEMHCYIRIAKPEFIENWKKEKKLKRLGMPKYLGSGSHEYQGQKYRFMVMERFGDDLQKIIERHDKKFSYKTVVQVAIQILDVLEYIHSYEYIHADIKASNLLVGYQPGTQNQVFLVDYGLACRYKIDGNHKEYKYDQRKAHDGTIEFTSRDAHIGAHSRRGDLEILGYNLVQWLCGKLPWEDNLQDCNYVAGKKRALMEDVPKLMNTCFANEIPPGVQEYMEYVASLTFDEKPNYEKCRNILRDGLKKRGYKEDGKLVFMSATPKQSKPSSRLTGRKVSKNIDYQVDSDFDSETASLSPIPKKKKCVGNARAKVSSKVSIKRSPSSKRKKTIPSKAHEDSKPPKTRFSSPRAGRSSTSLNCTTSSQSDSSEDEFEPATTQKCAQKINGRKAAPKKPRRKIAPAQNKTQKSPLLNGIPASLAATIHNPTPHMLALLERYKTK